jgi:hypothetical protein
MMSMEPYLYVVLEVADETSYKNIISWVADYSPRESATQHVKVIL